MTSFYTILLIILSLTLFIAGIFLLVKRFLDQELKRQAIESQRQQKNITLPLRLQAYERLVLYLERIAPENLIMRTYKPGMSAKLLQNDLTKIIREEYEHNLAQQMYISSNAWEMIKKTKEESIKLVHLCANKVPEDASGMDLSKQILNTYVGTEKQPHAITLDFLKREVRTLF